MRYRLGEMTNAAGFVTAEKFLLNQSLREIEKRLGYNNGRLMQGAYFLRFIETPTLQDMCFEPVGYSNVAGHNFNMPSDLDKKKLKEIVINYWRKENIQLVKVIPVIGHNSIISNDIQYPSGSGVPQWKLTKEFPAKVVAVFGPEDYSNHVHYKKILNPKQTATF